MTEDWTRDDAIRVLGIALFRREYKDDPGSLPANGTMGEIAFDDAYRTMRRCPGLRYVLEAGVRALADDEAFQKWLIPLYAGGADDCLTAETVIANTFAPDPPPPAGAMTPEQVGDALIADLHERAANGWL